MEYKRVFIEKKEEFNTESKLILKEFRDFLAVASLSRVRIVNVYDLIGGRQEEYEEIIDKILYEEGSDILYEGELPIRAEEKAFRVAYHQGQYNKREDSANQLIRLLTGKDGIILKNSEILLLEGIGNQDLEKVKGYYINPIEMKEISLDSFIYDEEREEAGDLELIEAFIDLDQLELGSLKYKYGIGMDIEDLEFCQEYFRNEEKRDPTITELKLIDTYWSDHCRHTTFMTEITSIAIEEGKYQQVFQGALEEYIKSREYLYGKSERPISLMDLATINMKEIKKKGLLDDKEETDEVNACSIEIDVDLDGREEKWLLMFKNETHNHPTEMEPFGGAATCLGGAIRDPLSGRAYVYQAMRITGSADPRRKYKDTLTGKLAQRKITKTARAGYSSYGNEIGAATGYIREIYHEGYMAKRMELGALVAAVPKDNVVRGQGEAGDLIILLGGRTGRDGLGGAVGSSREHTEKSLHISSAEVQKGNPAIERKIVRLFRNKELTRMIKKSNDFGAGGVSVAIGELADGLYIELDKIPLKYPGLDGSEIALSESQERMAVVISPDNLQSFMEIAREEDVEATLVARVTEEKRLIMVWRGRTIVDIGRDFLDSNGIRKKARVNILSPDDKSYLDGKETLGPIEELFIANIGDLNICSQKGLVEGFDHTVGAATVLMPLGGKNELTPTEGMVAKIPLLEGETTTCSLMTYGYDPKLSTWSPFHGGYYAVVESIGKIVALGGDYKKVRLTFQEYFERLGNDESKWGKPLAALLGAFTVQKALDIPSIGGKDSMSGSFEDLHVPPTLVSFAVTVDKVENIISPEFKKVGSQIGLIRLGIDQNGLLDLEELKASYSAIKDLVDRGDIISASSVKYGGIARSISEMAMGNKIGFEFEEIDRGDLFRPLYGSMVLEFKGEIPEPAKGLYSFIPLGRTIEEDLIRIGEEKIDLSKLLDSFQESLEEVFPTNKGKAGSAPLNYKEGARITRKTPVLRPRVLIPVFTGSHGEYDMARAFELAGGEVETLVFKGWDPNQSYKELAGKIGGSQILAFPNGALLGDEPEAGGKLMRIIFENPYMREALDRHLNKRDGLILGIGTGFTGLIKLGLLGPSIYMAKNESGGFLSTMVNVRVSSNLSPWFSQMSVGDIYSVPLARQEGRIIADKAIDNGQISTQFAGENPTGSSFAIESMTSPDGRVLGTISSIDRTGEDLYKNLQIVARHRIFESGIKYFR